MPASGGVSAAGSLVLAAVGAVLAGGAATAEEAPAAPAPPPAARGGVWLMGGIARGYDGGSLLRAEIGRPLPRASAPRLRCVIATFLHYEWEYVPDFDGGGSGSLSAGLFGVSPCIQYDWPLPIRASSGDAVLVLEGGVGAFVFWIRSTGIAYVPPGTDSLLLISGRVAAAFQYRGRGGLLLSFQPLGVVVPLHHTEMDSPIGHVETNVAFELAVTAGYQFR